MTGAPPQYSPDGRWWWDGQQWLPVQPPPGYGQPGYGYPTQGYGQAQPTDGKAIASLVTGLIWVWGLGSIAAVILGHLSRSEAKKQNRPPSGLALAGLILGYIGIAGAALVIGLFALGASGNVEIARSEPLEAIVPSEQSSQLHELALAEETYRGVTGGYTQDTKALAEYGWQDVDGIVVVRADSTSYCLGSFLGSDTLYLSSDAVEVSSTPCV